MILTFIPAFSLTASAAFAGANGGSGTEDSPYEIAGLEQLEAFVNILTKATAAASILS